MALLLGSISKSNGLLALVPACTHGYARMGMHAAVSRGEPCAKSGQVIARMPDRLLRPVKSSSLGQDIPIESYYATCTETRLRHIGGFADCFYRIRIGFKSLACIVIFHGRPYTLD